MLSRLNPQHHAAALALAVLVVLSSWMSSCSSSKGPDISCIAAGSRIDTPAGTVKIETLRLGDTVLSVNPETGERVPARVVFMRGATRPCLRLTTRCGHSVTATAEHPFLSPETRRYEPTEKWATGTLTKVYRSSGASELTVTEVVRGERLPGQFQVFDIGVDSVHHNFVAEGFVVHNKSIVEELRLAGAWQGTFVATNGVSGTLELRLTRESEGKVVGTAEFDSGSCVETGRVEARSWGVLDGTITLDDTTVILQASELVKGTLTGSYRVQSGEHCLGFGGSLELRQVNEPLASRQDHTELFQVIRVDEDGVEELGTAVIGR